MNNQDNLAAQVPIDVQCKCGWVGKSDQLMRQSLNTSNMYCPECHRTFEAWPFRALGQ